MTKDEIRERYEGLIPPKHLDHVSAVMDDEEDIDFKKPTISPNNGSVFESGKSLEDAWRVKKFVF